MNRIKKKISLNKQNIYYRAYQIQSKIKAYNSKIKKLKEIIFRAPLEKVLAHLCKLRFRKIDGKNMYYSNQIASLQWPVVFHIQCTVNSKCKNEKRISCLQSDHGLIISRCMGQFIHICPSSPDWQTNKSFEKFIYWYQKQQNRKNPIDEALKKYITADNE